MGKERTGTLFLTTRIRVTSQGPCRSGLAVRKHVRSVQISLAVPRLQAWSVHGLVCWTGRRLAGGNRRVAKWGGIPGSIAWFQDPWAHKKRGGV